MNSQITLLVWLASSRPLGDPPLLLVVSTFSYPEGTAVTVPHQKWTRYTLWLVSQRLDSPWQCQAVGVVWVGPWDRPFATSLSWCELSLTNFDKLITVNHLESCLKKWLAFFQLVNCENFWLYQTSAQLPYVEYTKTELSDDKQLFEKLKWKVCRNRNQEELAILLMHGSTPEIFKGIDENFLSPRKRSYFLFSF